METWDNEIAELRPAYAAVRDAKAIIKAEVRAKYRVIAEDEILERVKDSEYKFARQLADVKERSGIPVTVLQDHIFRTKSWSVWEKWRDLANLEPERVAKNTRASRLTYGDWEDDFSILWVRKNEAGRVIEPPIPATKFAYRKRGGLHPRFECTYWDESVATDTTIDARVTDLFGGPFEFLEFIKPEIEKQAALGNVAITPAKQA